MLATLAVVAALVFSTVYLALHLRLHLTQDSREPRMIETAIPYFTPVFGLRDNKYFVKLRYAFFILNWNTTDVEFIESDMGIYLSRLYDWWPVTKSI
jgi:hypothetical protein